MYIAHISPPEFRHCLFTCSLLAAILLLPLHAATYYVAKTGSDGNPGTQASPFLTINKGAQVAQPGDVVLVHAGLYREYVQPPRGGTAENSRITYRAAQDEDVFIKGTERIATWQSQGNGVWKADIQDSFFGSYHPYTSNIQGRWSGQFIEQGSWCHLGEVFLDDVRYDEKQTLAEVQGASKTWYTSHVGTTTSIYANFGSANPNTQLAEISVRESCFGNASVYTGINYITVDGFKMSQSAEEWSPYFLSTPLVSHAVIFVSGTNWIIENCTVTYGKMRGISIDGPNVPSNHIVRNNIVKHIGVSGIGGCYSHGSVICGNWIDGVGEDRPYCGPEGGGMKIHLSNCITIAGNVIRNITNKTWGLGIWLDWVGKSNRITGNIIANTPNGAWAFLENPSGPNLIDNNIVVGYCHDAGLGDGNAVINNLFSGVYIYFGADGWAKSSGKSNRAFNNIWIKGGYSQILQGKDNASDYNAFLEYAGKSWDDAHSISTTTSGNFSAVFDSTARTVTVSFAMPDAAVGINCPIVTTSSLGPLDVTVTNDMQITNPDGSSLTVDKDYFQNCRGVSTKVGPFKGVKAGVNTFVLRPNSNFVYNAGCGQVQAGRPLHRPMLTNGNHSLTYYDLRGRLVATACTARPGTCLSRVVYTKPGGRSGILVLLR